MKDKIKVQDSKFYSEYFDNLQEEDIYVFLKAKSQEIWKSLFDEKAKSYFQLPNNNWIIKSKEIHLGTWIDDYNDDISKNVSNKLENTINWKDDDKILFCINDSSIIESSWLNFKTSWIDFLSCEDDAVLIVNPNNLKTALIFYSIGTFFKLEREIS